MNILMTASTFPRWKNDAELSIVLDIAVNLKKYHPNLNISVLVPHYPGTKTFEIIKGVKIYRYRYFFQKWEKLHYNGGMMFNIKRNKFNLFLIPFSFIAQLLAIIKLVKKEKIKIIHAHWIIPQGFIAVLYKKIFNKNIKIVCTAHGSDVSTMPNFILLKIKKYTLSNVNKITTVSNFLKNQIKNNIADVKINVIYNGINKTNTQKFKTPKHLTNNKFVNLLFVGRLTCNKGVQHLIKAMPLLLKTYKNIRLIIVGYGPNLSKLKNLSQELKITNNVIFEGQIERKNVFSYYKLADIFISPAVNEGFGLIYIEAMQNLLPVIAVLSGASSEIIQNKKTGILISSPDKNKIIKAILTLLADKQLRQNLITNAKKMVTDKFNWQKISLDYYKNYLKI